MSDNLIGPSKAANILGVSERTVTRWAIAGRLPVARTLPSGQRRFDREAIVRLAAEMEAAA